MLTPIILEVVHRQNQQTEKIQVVEVPFSVLHTCCIGGLDDIALADASVRRMTSAGVYETRVMPGFVDGLDDDSSIAVIEAALKLNITPSRIKKVAGLLTLRNEAFHGPQPSITSKPSNSSFLVDTSTPETTPAQS